MVLSKVVVEPGRELALAPPPRHPDRAHRRRRPQLHGRERPAVVREGSSEDPRKVRTIKAGQTARLRPGQWLVEQPSDVHRAANRGGKPVVIFLATLLEKGAPPATPVP